MSDHRDHLALLAQMEAARGLTGRHLRIIERQIEGRAERLTVTDRVKHRQHGRGASTWTPADERLFQQHVAELSLAHRGEIEALTRKLDRQEKAIDVYRSQHQLSAAVSERFDARGEPSILGTAEHDRCDTTRSRQPHHGVTSLGS